MRGRSRTALIGMAVAVALSVLTAGQVAVAQEASDPVDVGAIHESLPFPNLDIVDDTADNVYNSRFDNGACSVDVQWPQKVQDSTTGEYYIYSAGAASCPGYDYVAVKTCVQIRVAGDWKRVNCSAGGGWSSSAGAGTLGPCRAGTWRYRTKFTWAASRVAASTAEGGAESISALPSGTRKAPKDGIKITCPV